MTNSVSARYAALVVHGHIDRDPAQEMVAEKLDALAHALVQKEIASKGSALGWLFGRKARPEALRGLYVWGSVGRGKTMLMDLFFESLDVRRKRRAHFHAFMSDVHERIFVWRQAAKRGEVKGADPIQPVAQALAADATVLCFDELAVTDIADAMLLGRLFENLFAQGVTILATSNREPHELYKDGLNRSLFLPFIAMLGERLEVVKLDARTDFRLEKLAGAAVYLTPADAAAAAAMAQMFDRLTGHSAPHEARLAVKGREVVLPETAQGVVRASFAELCDRPLGAADYLAIAQNFHTVFLSGVPAMGQDQRNAAKRFITLIDVLYDNNVKLVMSAEVPAEALYRGTSGAEVFEFDRTVSRLIEMRSEEYLARPHGHNADKLSGSSEGLVET